MMGPTGDGQGSARDRERTPSVARDTAGDVAEALRGVARPYVEEAASSLSFMVLAVLLVPVGIVIVALGFVAMGVAFAVLGFPTGLLATAITVAGLLGILAALFYSFRALYRRMPRRLRSAYAAPMDPAGPDLASVSIQRDTRSGDSTERTRPPEPVAPSLAELDARLARIEDSTSGRGGGG